MILHFLLRAVTAVAFIPALKHVLKHKNHFSLYIGVMQVSTALCYNTADALGTDVWLSSDEWSMITDVCSITYVCVLAIHYMQLTDPDLTTALRYVAFTLAWLTKEKDGRISTWAQVIVISGFILAALTRIASGAARVDKLDKPQAQRGAALLALAAVGLGVEMRLRATDFYKDGSTDHQLELMLGGDVGASVILALVHCSAGAAVYYLWSACPPMGVKQLDHLQSFI
eukprot:g6246.t1